MFQPRTDQSGMRGNKIITKQIVAEFLFFLTTMMTKPDNQIINIL